MSAHTDSIKVGDPIYSEEKLIGKITDFTISSTPASSGNPYYFPIHSIPHGANPSPNLTGTFNSPRIIIDNVMGQGKEQTIYIRTFEYDKRESNLRTTLILPNDKDGEECIALGKKIAAFDFVSHIHFDTEGGNLVLDIDLNCPSHSMIDHLYKEIKEIINDS